MRKRWEAGVYRTEMVQHTSNLKIVEKITFAEMMVNGLPESWKNTNSQ